MTEPTSGGWSWRLWWTQILVVLRIELKKNFLSRRSWWVYPLVFGPAGLTTLHSIFMWYRGGSGHSISLDVRIFATVFQYGYLRMGIYFGCVVLFMNLFRGEVLNRTLHYYFLAPIRREVLAVGKYLAALVASIILFGGSVAVSFLTLMMHQSAGFEEFLYHDGGLSQLGSYLLVTVLACFGYGAVFLVMGLLFRNPMIPAAVVLAWESLNTFLPPALKKVSVILYLKSLCPVEVPDSGLAALLGVAADPMRESVAIAGLLVLALATLVFAAHRARKVEISYSD